MKRILPAVLATLALSACGVVNHHNASDDTVYDIINGKTRLKYAQFPLDYIQRIDTATPVVQAGNKRSAELKGLNFSYTGQLNGAALAIAMRKMLADDILFSHAFLTNSFADCLSCRVLEAVSVSTQVSLQLPAVNYSKTTRINSSEGFEEVASRLYSEVDSTLSPQDCKPIPGSQMYAAEAPLSDGKSYLLVRFVCRLPKSIENLATKANFDNLSAQAGLLVKDVENKNFPILYRFLIISKDKNNDELINTAVISRCPFNAALMTRKNAVITASDLDLCAQDDAGFNKENGWTKLTTKMAKDDQGVIATIVVDGPEWSGVIPSPLQERQFINRYQ